MIRLRVLENKMLDVNLPNIEFNIIQFPHYDLLSLTRYLTLPISSIDNNPHLVGSSIVPVNNNIIPCQGGSCKKRRKTVVHIVAPVILALIMLIVMVYVFRRINQRRRKRGKLFFFFFYIDLLKRRIFTITFCILTNYL